MSEALGQQLVIDNRASGIIPGEVAARTAPDGYSLLFYNNTLWVAPLIQKASYDAVKDFVAVTLVSRSPNILVVHSALPVTSVQQLIALAKKPESKISYGSPGIGNTIHLASAMLNARAGTDMVHVPYKGGGPVLSALMAGEIQWMFGNPSTVLNQVKAGRLRALVVTSNERTKSLPEVPAAAESLPGYVVTGWLGIGVPKNTPVEIVDKLNAEMVRILGEADVKEKLNTLAFTPVGDTREQFAAYIKSEIAKWGKAVRDSGAKAD